jgi:hypothetical protein
MGEGLWGTEWGWDWGYRRVVALCCCRQSSVTCIAHRYQPSTQLEQSFLPLPCPVLLSIARSTQHQSPTGTKFLLMVEPQCPQVPALLGR